MHRSTVRSLAAFFAVWLVACTTWTRPEPLGQVLQTRKPGQVQVTLNDGRRIDLQHPTVQGDTLVGDTIVTRRGEYEGLVQARFPVAAVRSLQTRQFSAGKTAILVVGTTAVIAALFGLALAASDFGSMDFGSSGSSCEGGGM